MALVMATLIEARRHAAPITAAGAQKRKRMVNSHSYCAAGTAGAADRRRIAQSVSGRAGASRAGVVDSRRVSGTTAGERRRNAGSLRSGEGDGRPERGLDRAPVQSLERVIVG